MLFTSYVPEEFAYGITIPIPKVDSECGALKIESFRGITLIPILSKVLENCILMMFDKYFITSENQFGFKSKVGCSHAIYMLRKVVQCVYVEYYKENDTTVNLCFIDMEKAFDKINHFVLFGKLMKRQVPVLLIKLLQCWYGKSRNYVRWEGVTSNP